MPVQVQCTMLDAWGWCTGTTQRDGMGRCCSQCPVPVLGPCRPTPPQETLTPAGGFGSVSRGVTTLFLWVLVCTWFCCALQDWSLCFPQSCGSLVVKSSWASGSDSLGIPSPFVGSAGWKSLTLGSKPLQQWENLSDITVLQFLRHPPGRYGI